MSERDCNEILRRRDEWTERENSEITRALERATEDIKDEVEIARCYSEETQRLMSRVSELSREGNLIRHQTELQSELLTKNFMFISEINQLYDNFSKRAKYHLGHYPAYFKSMISDAIQKKITPLIQDLIQNHLIFFHDIAKKLNVQNYSLSFGIGIVQFTLTFGVP